MIKGTIFVDATCDKCGKEQRIELSMLPERWPSHRAVERIGWTYEWNPCPTSREQHHGHFCRQCWLEKRIADKSAELARMREELSSV